MISDWLYAVWGVFVQSAPWLLVGFFVAGLLHAFLPRDTISALLRKRGFGSILKASAVGIPLPLCSCSVIPVGVSLRRAGASRGATASFFVSTPEIGVDSFLLSYGLLGPVVALARVVSAFLSAMTVGLLIDKFADSDPVQPATEAKNTHSCCHQESSDKSEANKLQQVSFIDRMRVALRYGFVEIVDDVAILLLIGICLSGIITVAVPADALSFAGRGQLFAMFAMLFVSLPLYVCAASSTPIAAALMAKGLAPGAAIVFLLAGPASNISTMLVLRREFGNRGLLFYIFGIASIAFISGLMLNNLLRSSSDYGQHLLAPHLHLGVFDTVMGLILLAVMLPSVARTIAKRFGPRQLEPHCH